MDREAIISVSAIILYRCLCLCHHEQSLSPAEIAERWLAFHQGPLLVHRWLREDTLSISETERCLEIIESWREHLTSNSWFMRLLNQHIATEANREDKCTGHFWEGRFKSQALLDEKALAAAMAYVDLNPVRAAIAPTPEQSEHTSVKARVASLLKDETTAPYLFPFFGNLRENMPEGIPFRLRDYLELVEWTGRQIREDKLSHIENTLPSLLDRLGLEPDCWLNTCMRIEQGSIVGSESAIKAALPHLNRQRMSGLRLPDR